LKLANNQHWKKNVDPAAFGGMGYNPQDLVINDTRGIRFFFMRDAYANFGRWVRIFSLVLWPVLADYYIIMARTGLEFWGPDPGRFLA